MYIVEWQDVVSYNSDPPVWFRVFDGFDKVFAKKIGMILLFTT